MSIPIATEYPLVDVGAEPKAPPFVTIGRATGASKPPKFLWAAGEPMRAEVPVKSIRAVIRESFIVVF